MDTVTTEGPAANDTKIHHRISMTEKMNTSYDADKKGPWLTAVKADGDWVFADHGL